MRYKFLFIVVYSLILCVSKIFCGGTCPSPSVEKQTIIQSSASIERGAKLIGKDIVESARECYKLCCNDLSCNVAVMHYKQKTNVLGEDITEKYCFLFHCGAPSVCTYERHRRYAIIDLGSREEEIKSVVTTTTTTTTTSTTTKKTATTTLLPTTIIPSTVKEIAASVSPSKVDETHKISSTVKTTGVKKVSIKDGCKNACGYNYDPVCGDDGTTYDNKCLFDVAKCKKPTLNLKYDEACRECPPGVPMAMCSDDPCKISSCPLNQNAVCKANFCGGCNAVYHDENGNKVNCSDSGVVVSHEHNEQSVTVDAGDYEEAPDEALPKAKGDDTKDPYYKGDKRKWLETGGKNMTDSHSKVPVVVVVKENSASALMSLPLLIALIICIILLIGVVYRVKCVSRGRAKKLPVDDGDYLINGMYL